jgi:ABC-type transport system involved in multi-copper enzyme maturation permease subunit
MFTYLWLKEIKAQVYTWKGTLWLVIASLLFSFTSYLLLTDKELSLLDQTELLWLLSKVIIGMAFLIVAVDSSSIINSEFEKETAESLFLSPVDIRDFVFGKLLASLTLWFAVFAVATPYIMVTSMGTRLVLPFLGYALVLGTIGISGMIILIFGISFLYRSTKNTLTTSLIILLGLSVPALFSSALRNNAFAQIFGRINPLENTFECLDNVLVDYRLSSLDNWRYVWPLFLFCVIAFVFLLFSVNRFQKQGVTKSVET